jgi:hypothetical protein
MLSVKPLYTGQQWEVRFPEGPVLRSFTVLLWWSSTEQMHYASVIRCVLSVSSQWVLRFYVPLKNISLIWRRHHYRWRTAKFRPILGAQGLWAGGGSLSCHTCCDTGPRVFSVSFEGLPPFSRLLRHRRGCGGHILTRILTGFKSIDTMTL